MAYSLRFNEAKKLLVIEYNTSSSFDDRISALQELTSHLEEDPTLNVLIDASSARESMSDAEQEKYAQLLGENSHHFSQNRTAIYNPQLLHRQALASSYTYGLTRFVEFTNKTEAVQWAMGEIN